MRLNCVECNEPREPSPQEQAWLASMIETGESLFSVSPKRGRGCSACNGTGYSGRQGIYELLEMDTVLTQAALRSDPATFMRQARERMKGHTLAHHVFSLVRQGKTSLAEALRIGFDVDEQEE